MLPIKLGYYRKEDWEKFISIIDDRESMHSTWYEWHEAYNKSKKDLEKQGFFVIKAVVDLDKLIEYCAEMKLKNIGSSRSQFISQI
jgi:hypothetical protein